MSTTNYQFPPSSPLISNADYAYDDPFSMSSKPVWSLKSQVATIERGRTSYPTPNPSSSIFRSSSPVSEVVEKVAPEQVTVQAQAQVRLNKDFNILDPDSSVTRAVLLRAQRQITLGRSSRANDYVFGKVDKYVSRVHVLVNYSPENLVLKCVGTNGFLLRIPRSCFVFETDKKKTFVIETNPGNPLNVEKELARQARNSISVNENHTEFSVNNGETITMPRFANVLIEVNRNVVLLNPDDCDEELTEDEDMCEMIEEKHASKVHKSVETTSNNCHNYTPPNPVRTQMPSTPEKRPHFMPPSVSEGTPSKPQIKATSSDPSSPLNPAAPSVQTDKCDVSFSEDVTNVKIPHKFEIFADTKEQGKQETKLDVESRNEVPSVKPLSTVNNNTPVVTKLKAKTSELKRKKAKKLPQTDLVEIDQSWLDGVDGIEEINNVLINHLAFSRLSSTPASFLQTISPLTSSLSLRQIRVVLHNVECIGVIYRTGKDAAGKPLEEEYYYMPENDTNENRQLLISSIKGSSGLRSCRRTHKQYYWKKPAPIKK